MNVNACKIQSSIKAIRSVNASKLLSKMKKLGIANVQLIQRKAKNKINVFVKKDIKYQGKSLMCALNNLANGIKFLLMINANAKMATLRIINLNAS